MDDFDDYLARCAECRTYGDDYYYDKDGDLISNCCDCPMNPWMREVFDD